MTFHNYRSWQVHESGVNPSSGFRGIRSAKSGPNLWQNWQVFGPWASPYGANGQMTMTVHNYRPRQFHRTSNLTSVKRLQRYGFRKSGSRPPGPWRQYPSSPEGWGVKSQWSVLLAFSVGNPLVTGEFFSQWTINKDIRTKSWWLSSQCVIIHKSSKRCTNIYCVIEIAINEGIRKIHISVSWKTSTRIIILYLNL